MMAALTRHEVLKGIQDFKFCGGNIISMVVAHKKTDWRKPNIKKEFTRARNIESMGESLLSKGFLRSYKPYTPAPDVKDTLKLIYEKVFDLKKVPVTNDLSKYPEMKFSLLSACFEEFKHAVPNSLLHTIDTFEDLLHFYNTPVNTTIPFDNVVKADLPENLHIQYDYHRFHPDTDTMFGGVSAFPQSSVIVTGLKYKKKYQGFKAIDKFPDTIRDNF